MAQVGPDPAYPPPPPAYEPSQAPPPSMNVNMAMNMNMNMPVGMMGMPNPMEQDQWMPPPPPSSTCPPGLEMLEILDTIQVTRSFDFRANLTSMIKRVEFKAKNSGGLLAFTLAREVTSFDCCQNPSNYVISVFDQNGMEPFRGIYSGEGCCGGCCSGSVCACTRAKEFSIHIPNGSEVATVEQKCSCCGIKYEVDNLDTSTKWKIYSNTCMWCYVRGSVVDFDITDETNGVPLGKIRKVSDIYSDRIFKTYTYAVDFEPGLDAKTKAKMFMMSTYIAALYYEFRGNPNQGRGRRRRR